MRRKHLEALRRCGKWCKAHCVRVPRFCVGKACCAEADNRDAFRLARAVSGQLRESTRQSGASRPACNAGPRTCGMSAACYRQQILVGNAVIVGGAGRICVILVRACSAGCSGPQEIVASSAHANATPQYGRPVPLAVPGCKEWWSAKMCGSNTATSDYDASYCFKFRRLDMPGRHILSAIRRSCLSPPHL